MKDCVSLEVAKKLKEAGWPQVTTRKSFYWFIYKSGEVLDYCGPTWAIEGLIAHYLAPTIGELLEVLGLVELKALNNGSYRVWNHKNDHEHEGHVASNPADALAELWMALKEKGIV